MPSKPRAKRPLLTRSGRGGIIISASIIKPVANKRKTLLKAATLIVLLICGYVAFHWNQHRLLTVRSHVVEQHLEQMLPQIGDSVPIENLLPSDLVGAEKVALVCTVTPYQEPDDTRQLANLDYGWRFDFGGEKWIGVVALDTKGRIVTTARLSRLKVDLLPYTERGKCYAPLAAKLVNVGSSLDGGTLLTIESP